MWHVDKEEHSDLNFALGCLYCDAISLDEFKLWVSIVISSDIIEPPFYLYELLDFDEPLFHISKVIGFNVINTLSYKDEFSIYGIAYIRGMKIYDPPISMNEAIYFLKKNANVKEKFMRFFPFIDIILPT